MQLSLALHLVGIVFWFGGVLLLTRYLKVFGTSVQNNTAAARFLRGSWFGFVLSGMVIAIGTGLWQLMTPGYMKYGWMHAKLLLVVIAIGVTVYGWRCSSRMQGGQEVAPKTFAMLHGASALLLILIAGLVKLKPF